LIPEDFISEWKKFAPWLETYQVEQDLIISRALVEIFSHSLLAENLAFRGGTALFKLHLAPARYSEDIDLVQVHAGPIGPVMHAIQEKLNSWLGTPKRSRSEGRVTLIYRIVSEEEVPLKLKIEINTREHFSILGLEKKNFTVQSRWFSGTAAILTYPLDELLGTKMRALYQRKKGRDLYDLWKALTTAGTKPRRMIDCFLQYMEREGHKVSRAEFEQNLRMKMNDPRFFNDIKTVVLEDTNFDFQIASEYLINQLLPLIPGKPWQGKDG